MFTPYLLLALIVAVLIAGAVYLVRAYKAPEIEDDDVPPHRGPVPESDPEERRG